jgi:hypothetical protein
MVGRGSAVADVDGDGDLDLFVVDVNGPSRLFENRVGSRRAWITVEPLPGPDGRSVLGTRVRVSAGGRTQTQWYGVSPSYASGSLTPLHFGLGDASSAETVEVTFPGEPPRIMRDVPGREAYRVLPGGELTPSPAAAL